MGLFWARKCICTNSDLIENVRISENDLHVYKVSLQAEGDSDLELINNHLECYATKLDGPVFYSFPKVASVDQPEF